MKVAKMSAKAGWEITLMRMYVRETTTLRFTQILYFW